MENKIPLYELKINIEDGLDVNFISIVDEPAIESNFLYFNEQPKKTKQSFSVNDDKQEVLGVAMIPNKPIYRKEGDFEYGVFFSADEIRKIAVDFFAKGYTKNVNIQHESDLVVEATIFQSYIVDDKLGVKAPDNIDAVNGSWIVGMKIENQKVWELIKEKKLLKGFSIEGWFEQMFTSFINKDSFAKPTPKGQLLSTLNELESLLTDN